MSVYFVFLINQGLANLSDVVFINLTGFNENFLKVSLLTYADYFLVIAVFSESTINSGFKKQKKNNVIPYCALFVSETER